MCTHAAPAMYIHCACHGLQLASVQTTQNVPEVKIFVIMGNIWKLFYYSPPKKQAALKLPELKAVKPSDTRWLSH